MISAWAYIKFPAQSCSTSSITPYILDTMMFVTILILTICAVPTAAKVYTGFNYGAFWGEQSNVKRYADFYHGFELAKNLTNTPVPFDSARLYTCITAGSKDDPTEAFQAAIDTGTNLLLGMWVSPGATGQPNDAQVQSELAALGKGFEQYGQKLADLVIGISVGSEDIYRFNSGKPGLGIDSLMLTIKGVREKIAASQFAMYMQDKPIGHTDIPLYAVMAGLDFVGMNAYPSWEGKHINNANNGYMSVLRDTQRRAGNTPVWITELGWPIDGAQISEAVASPENYQRYWSEIGCQVFGKYNTFWFELLQDSQPEQPDWGLLDTKSYQPRIKNLGCGAMVSPPAPTTGTVSKAPISSSSNPEPSTLSTVYPSFLSSAPATQVLTTISGKSTAVSTQSVSTTHVTRTSTITVSSTSPATTDDEVFITVYLTTTTYIATSPTSPPLATGTTSNPKPNDKLAVCIAMVDLMGDGVFIPVATYAANISTCRPPPRFTGSPFTMIAAPPSTPTGLLNNTSALAPCTASPSASTPSAVISSASTALASSSTSSADVISALSAVNEWLEFVKSFAEHGRGSVAAAAPSSHVIPTPLPPLSTMRASSEGTTTSGIRRSPGPAVLPEQAS